MSVAAMLSVATLLGVSAWRVSASMRVPTPAPIAVVTQNDTGDTSQEDLAMQQQEKILLGQSTTVGVGVADTSTSTDPIAMIGPMVTAQMVGQYAGLQDQGTYSSTTAAIAAGNIAANMRAAISYKTFVLNDLKTDPDTSYTRMLKYRADLRIAFEPLLKNSANELDLFAKYEETEIKRLLRKFSKKARRARKVLSEHDSHLQPGEHSSPVAISQNVRKYLDKKRLALRTYDELIASFENDLREIAAEDPHVAVIVGAILTAMLSLNELAA